MLQTTPTEPAALARRPDTVGPLAVATPTTRRLADASISLNTRRAYLGALRRLDAWRGAAPVDDASLAVYLGELFEAGRAPATAALAVAAIKFRAKLAGQPDPAGEATARVLGGYRRTAADRGRLDAVIASRLFIGPPLVPVLDHGELVDREPVVAVRGRRSRVREPERRGPGLPGRRTPLSHQRRSSDGSRGFGPQHRPGRARQSAQGVFGRLVGQLGIEPGQRGSQAGCQDDGAVIGTFRGQACRVRYPGGRARRPSRAMRACRARQSSTVDSDSDASRTRADCSLAMSLTSHSVLLLRVSQGERWTMVEQI